MANLARSSRGSHGGAPNSRAYRRPGALLGASCHSLEEGKKKIGPSLYGVIGRTAGTAEGFTYSKAMKAYGESGVVWSAETLDPYLVAPRKVVVGTKMSFPGLQDEADRANVIAYLERFSK